VRRLFSTFAHGWPGAGLLLMRLVCGAAFIDCGVTRLRGLPGIPLDLLYLLAIGAGILLLAGLWTPVAGTFAAVFALWNTVSHPADLRGYVLMGTLGAALAMLGPGTWSVDARLFGWKRIGAETRRGRSHPS
jgi:uncharacterized membrane protein YphA (DoxX/SURF4 family)